MTAALARETVFAPIDGLHLTRSDGRGIVLYARTPIEPSIEVPSGRVSCVLVPGVPS
jgi:hypothetical protein